MATINMHDARTQLSDLVARAEAGEEIVIARRNRPVVRLVPVQGLGGAAIRDARRRVAARFAHLQETTSEADWLAPLPDAELDAWEGRPSGSAEPALR